MKNFTFLVFTFLMSIFGFSQELVVNGNFESGVSPWVGNAANVVTESGNSYNAANVAAAGNPWDVNLSQVLSLTSGKTYTFKFDAWSDRSRTLIAGIGLNEAPYSASTQTVNLTTTSQTFTLTLTAPATSANSRVIFDMGAAAGFVGIDNVSLVEVVATCNDGIQNGDETGVDCGGANCVPCSTVAAPSTAAPTPPARPVSDVVSIFSDAYTNIAVNAWGPDWGPYSSRINDYTADGNAAKVMKVASAQVFAGIDFPPSKFDATPFTHFHLDYWISPIPVGQVLNIKLSNHVGSGGETSAIQYTAVPSQAGQWVSLDIPLANFTAASAPDNLDRSAIAQIVISAARADNNVPVDIYMDNIYFHKNTLLGVKEVDASKNKLVIYPNPVSLGDVISVNEKVKTLEIFDLNGRKLKSATTSKVSSNGLSKGIYMMKVTNEKGEVVTNKLIIK